MVKKVYFIRQSEIDFYKRCCNNIEKPNEIFGCCLMYLVAFYNAVLSGEKGTPFSPTDVESPLIPHNIIYSHRAIQ